HLINGLVDWVDLEHDRLRVMGQPVTVAPLPRIPTGGSMELNDDSREQQRVLTQLRPGDRVVVSGHNSDSGEILATRVAVQSSIHPYVISGRVERPDAAQLRFALNALTIDYSVAQLQGFASGVPGAGDYVAAFGNLPPNGGIFEANRIIQLAGRFSGSSGATVEIEGLVTRVVSDVEFDVDGHPVELRRPAVCGDATTDVTVDTWVQLGGVLRSDGAVTDGVTGAYLCPVLFVDVDLIGPIDAISPGTLGLLGFAINDSVITQPGVDFSQLRVGDTVSVRATPGLTSHTLLASSITSAQAADPGSAQLDTRTYSLASPAINVAGRAILTTPATVYVDPQGMPESASWFFSKRWYVQCFKRSRDLSPLHLTLSRDERGQWLATRVAVSRFACPD
ncbi:MAG TPA: DUF5666 domain-containing protein, partial [Steroidobacteraceae bacterium]|nr:DUF5666 domain-containing protein [Steroidobacteraceae bacterium]